MSKLQGEDEAIASMIQDAKIYGYGRFIVALKVHWADSLILQGVRAKSALKATEVLPDSWEGQNDE